MDRGQYTIVECVKSRYDQASSRGYASIIFRAGGRSYNMQAVYLVPDYNIGLAYLGRTIVQRVPSNARLQICLCTLPYVLIINSSLRARCKKHCDVPAFSVLKSPRPAMIH